MAISNTMSGREIPDPTDSRLTLKDVGATKMAIEIGDLAIRADTAPNPRSVTASSGSRTAKYPAASPKTPHNSGAAGIRLQSVRR